jgi:hypothetical protein
MATTNYDNPATEPPIYIENVSHTRENDYRATAADGLNQPPVNPTEVVWNDYSAIPVAGPPGGLTPNGGPVGPPVELVSMVLAPVPGSALKWQFASWAPPGPPPTPIPSGAGDPLCRVVPATFGNLQDNPGAYTPVLTSPAGPPLPYDGHTWVVDGQNHYVEFPYGGPPATVSLTLQFYRYTGSTGGTGPELWHYISSTADPGVVLCPDPAYPGVPGSSNFVAPLPAQDTEAPGSFLMYDVGTSSLRAGMVTGVQWTAVNRGFVSTAFGVDNEVPAPYSTVAGGQLHTIGTGGGGGGNGWSFIGGGFQNTIPALMDIDTSGAFIGAGGYNTVSAFSASVVGGTGNTASGQGAFVGGGALNSPAPNNSATGVNSAVVGGTNNAASDDQTVVGGGENNMASDTWAAVVGGQNNTASSENAFVGAGNTNTASGTSSVVGGGANNVASQFGCFVGGGDTNQATGTRSAVAGGETNQATGPLSFVGGGLANQAQQDYAAVIGGLDCVAGDLYTTVGGGSTNRALAPFATAVGGNTNTASGSSSFIGGGTTNAAQGSNAAIGGGQSNQALDSFTFVGGGFSNTASMANGVVCGGELNQVLVDHGFIGGGTSNTVTGSGGGVGGGGANTAAGATSFVCGGTGNAATATQAFVGGGQQNTAGAVSATIGGGYQNQAGSMYATVGGGYQNLGNAQYAAVGGGLGNQVTGASATVPGGQNNIASGFGSVVCGAPGTTNADAGNNNVFIWGDLGGVDLSTVPGTGLLTPYTNSAWFACGADDPSGPFNFPPAFTIFTNSNRTGAPFPAPAMTGVVLYKMGNSWASLSDRDAKENLVELDPREILAKVAALPVYEYNYRGTPPGLKCRGPVAQDWHALFPSPAKDPRRIDTMDLDGITLAAVRGLEALAREQGALLAAALERIAGLEARLGK